MSRIHASLGFFRRPGPLVVVSLAYLLLVSGLMIWRGISVSPDYLLLILVPVAVLSGGSWASCGTGCRSSRCSSATRRCAASRRRPASRVITAS